MLTLLLSVPIEGWENDFPLIDICLKDSIRLNASFASFRRNTSGQSVPLNKDGSEVIPPGAYATYHLGELHFNPDIYKNPLDWDPSRYLPERAEDKKEPWGWVGWGVGRHPCAGKIMLVAIKSRCRRCAR